MPVIGKQSLKNALTEIDNMFSSSALIQDLKSKFGSWESSLFDEKILYRELEVHRWTVAGKGYQNEPRLQFLSQADSFAIIHQQLQK